MPFPPGSAALRFHQSGSSLRGRDSRGTPYPSFPSCTSGTSCTSPCRAVRSTGSCCTSRILRPQSGTWDRIRTAGRTSPSAAQNSPCPSDIASRLPLRCTICYADLDVVGRQQLIASHLFRPRLCFGSFLRYFSISIPPMYLSNAITGSVTSKYSSRNTVNVPALRYNTL